MYQAGIFVASLKPVYKLVNDTFVGDEMNDLLSERGLNSICELVLII